MPTFVTSEYIRNQIAHLPRVRRDELLLEARQRTKSDIFLSYSTKDRELASDVAIFLEAQGLRVYIDYKDAELQTNEPGKKADCLRSNIRASKSLMVLLTQNSNASRWVPWELGIADEIKGANAIFVLPVDTDIPEESDFFKLYHRIKLDIGKIVLMEPGFEHYTTKDLTDLKRMISGLP